METRGRFIEWRLSMAETISAVITAAGLTASIIMWSMSKFEDKDHAGETKAMLERRMENLESQVSTMRASLESVARDTSYIRGRLEPKSRE